MPRLGESGIVPSVPPVSSVPSHRAFGATSLRELVQETGRDHGRQPPHVIVRALAGVGKTTVIVEGLRPLFGEEPRIIPSPQQQAIWEQLWLSRPAREQGGKVVVAAFLKEIERELKRRVPEGCDVCTLHAFGLRAITQALGRMELQKYKTTEILCEFLGVEPMEARTQYADLTHVVTELVRLCKVNLVGWDWDDLTTYWEEDLQALIDHHDLDLDKVDPAQVFELVPRILDRCMWPEQDHTRCIDYSDMIWLPIVRHLPVEQCAMLIVDEAQDMCRAQQEMVYLAGERVILVGDRNQACLGFAGADCEGMDRIETTLTNTPRGCIVLPLTVTRRCAKSIVREAQAEVPELEALPDAPEGEVCEAAYYLQGSSKRGGGEGRYEIDWEDSYLPHVRDGDFVLGRTNSVVVRDCLRFLSRGVKATVRGRAVGQGLVRLVNRLSNHGRCTVTELREAACLWAQTEYRAEMKKRHPNEAKLMSLADRRDCVLVFCDGSRNVDEVVRRIEAIFTDETVEGVRLSTIHKAKGLEADNVYLLNVEEAPIPHYYARTDWEKEQEAHLIYIAKTRARFRLVYVR